MIETDGQTDRRTFIITAKAAFIT